MQKVEDAVAFQGEEWRFRRKRGIVRGIVSGVTNAVGEFASRFRHASQIPAVSVPQAAPRLVYVGTLGASGNCDERIAQSIMGRNFMGLDAAITKFGIAMSSDELLGYPEIPWSEGELSAVKDTHMLVAGYPMTIMDIRAKTSRGAFYSYENAWYNNQRFANETRVGCRWYLVRKAVVPDSTSKTFGDQQKLLQVNEEVPLACELLYAVMLYYAVTGERLFQNIYVRCSDLDSDGGRVHVGLFDGDGLSVNGYWDEYRYDSIGCSSVRKSNE